MTCLLYADSPTASTAASARVFNPYATHTTTPKEPEPPISDGATPLETPATGDALSTLQPSGLQSGATAYPSSPFANHVPPPSSSLGGASEAGESAEVRQESSEVLDLAPAVETPVDAAAEERTAEKPAVRVCCTLCCAVLPCPVLRYAALCCVVLCCMLVLQALYFQETYCKP